MWQEGSEEGESSRSGSQRAGTRSYIGHNDDDFVCTSSKVGSHESSDRRKNILTCYQDHDGCCVENRLKWGKAKVETERLITKLLQ